MANGIVVTAVEALAALRSVAPFDRISDDGLALLLEAVAIQSYAGGESVQTETSASPRLQIVIAGSVTDQAGALVGPVLGLAGMFTDAPLPALMAAVASGASVVSLDRQAFFTLARASPELVRGFLETGPGGGASKVPGSRV